MYSSIVILAQLLSAANVLCQPPAPVYFSFIYSGGGAGGFDSSGVIPAVDIALEEIERNNLLPGYNLTYDQAVDSQCSRTTSLDVFFKDTDSNPVAKIAVIGCGCSPATEPVAEISHHWNISQISYASPLSTLSDRERFRNYFRTNPTFNNYALALLALVNSFNWKRLAFITQNEDVFQTVHTDFLELQENLKEGTSKECCFDEYNTTTRNVVFESVGDTLADVQELFDGREYHVFFVNCFFRHARRIICEAAKRNLVYPNYAWIFYGLYPTRWWTEEVTRVPLEDCTDEQLEQFLFKSRGIMAHIVPEPNSLDSPSSAGISSRNFTTVYVQRAMRGGYRPNFVAHTGAFDAVWSLAEALRLTEDMRINNTTTDKCNASELPGELVRLNDFEYSNALMGCVVKSNLESVNFTGVTGPVQYGEDGTIIYSRIRLAQPRYVTNSQGEETLQRVRFGYLDKDSNFSLQFLEEENVGNLYPAGAPPDGTPVEIIHTYQLWLVAIYDVLALLGVCLVIVCFSFNFLFRNRRVIRLTSPTLNNIIIGGALLMYLSVIVDFIPSIKENVIEAQCIVHVWVYVLGYLLVYGTILAKMWRVYQIFHNPTSKRKMALKTFNLLWVVAGITTVGVLLVLGETIAQLFASPELVSDAENTSGITESDVLETYYIWRCYSTDSPPMILQLLIFIYLILLQVVGIILAFQTRKVKINVLNDAKSVAVLIYISSIVLVVIGLIKFFVRSYINVSAAIFSGGILVLATFFLALIFIPKMISLYRDPSGEKVFDGTMSIPSRNSDDQQQSYLALKLPNLTDPEKIELMNAHIKTLEERMSMKNKRIHELESSSS